MIVAGLRLCTALACSVCALVLAPAAAPAAAVDWWGHTLEPGVTQSRIQVGGLSTRILQAGPADSREAVVFVHGNPGSSLDWTHLVSVAGRYNRAIGLDMPGFGRADKPPPDKFEYTSDTEADFLGRMLTQLGIDKVHLVLHDFGGPFGLQWAIRHPDALKSIVLIDTGVFINYYGHGLALVWHTPGVGDVAMETQTKPTFTAVVQSGNPRLLPQDFVDRMWDEFDLATRKAAAKLYQSSNNPDKQGREQAAILRRRKRPALVIWGEFDQYIPLYVAYEQEQAFPGAQVHPLDSGHWPFVDNVDKVDALVAPFWAKAVPRFVPGAAVKRTLRVKRLQRLRGARVTRRRAIRVRVCVKGGRVDGVRVRLYRRQGGRRRLAGSSGRARSVVRCRRVGVRLKQRLRHGARYRLVARGSGVAPAKRAFRVR